MVSGRKCGWQSRQLFADPGEDAEIPVFKPGKNKLERQCLVSGPIPPEGGSDESGQKGGKLSFLFDSGSGKPEAVPAVYEILHRNQQPVHEPDPGRIL